MGKSSRKVYEWDLSRITGELRTSLGRLPKITELVAAVQEGRGTKISNTTAQLALMAFAAQELELQGDHEGAEVAKKKLEEHRERIRTKSRQRATASQNKRLNLKREDILLLLGEAYKIGLERPYYGETGKLYLPTHIANIILNNGERGWIFARNKGAARYSCPAGHPWTAELYSLKDGEAAPDTHETCLFCEKALRRIAPTPAPPECSDEPTPLEIAIAEAKGK